MALVSFTCWLLLLIIVLGASEGSSIVPGAIWTDRNGDPIQSHKGSFIKHENFWYWFGLDGTDQSLDTKKVKVYRSVDLVSWEFRRNALSLEKSLSSSINSRGLIIENPKVLYNEKVGKFVMWFHLDDSFYSVAKLGVAYSLNVDGPYTYLGSVSPLSHDSHGMTVWKDDDGAAYVIYGSNWNTNTVIASLSSDYLTINSKVYEFHNFGWESFGMFKANGLYYLTASGFNGTETNVNYYVYSESLEGPWSKPEEISIRSVNEFRFRTNDVISVSNVTFIWAADSSNDTDFTDPRYVWIPIDFSPENKLRISWRPEWWIDASTGQKSNSYSTRFECEDSTVASLSGGASVISCSACSNGLAVGHVGFDKTLAISPIIVSKTTAYTVVVGYINGDLLDRKALMSVNGVSKITVRFPSTGSWDEVKELVVRLELNKGGNAIQFSNPKGNAPDFDYLRVQWY